MHVRLKQALVMAGIGSGVILLPACEPYRIEYRTRPAYYREAAVGGLPDCVTLEDGTVLVYNTNEVRNTSDGGEQKEFKLREELDDGTIVLRAVIPEHVIANTIECLQNEEYELLYEQMLSEHTRLAWEAQGRDVEDFAAFFGRHRGDMIRGLTRIYLGLSQLEALMEQHENGVIECRLRRELSRNESFTRVRVIREGYGLKLLNIR